MITRNDLVMKKNEIIFRTTRYIVCETKARKKEIFILISTCLFSYFSEMFVFFLSIPLIISKITISIDMVIWKYKYRNVCLFF